MIIIIDGPPASGKSTLVRFLKLRYCANTYYYKRLGLNNVFYALLLRIAPDLQCCRLKGDRVDPIILVNPTYLMKMSIFTLILEIIYKCIEYFLLLLLALMNQCLIIDEGVSLGWANYLNLMLFKKALRPNYVIFLMRFDLNFFHILSRLHKIYYYFIDRSLEKLEMFWYKRGNTTSYDMRYLLLVRYSFKLFNEISKKYGIKIKINRIYTP
jgi:hypothetical protein